MTTIQPGDCVKVPDGRVGRVRDIQEDRVRVRLMRTTSHTHQFIWYTKSDLKVVACPKGWMGPEGYNRYLKITLAKMKKLPSIFILLFVLLSVAQPVSAHEVYVLTSSQISHDLQVQNLNVFSSLISNINKLWFLFFAAAAVISLSVSFFVSFSRWGAKAARTIEKLSKFALPLIRIVFGIALISSAYHHSLFGPELSLSHLWMPGLWTTAFYILGLLLIVGLFIRISSVILLFLFFLSVLTFHAYMLTYINYLGEILVLLLIGADRFSLDSWLFKKSHPLIKNAEGISIALLRISFGIALLYAALYVKFLHPALAYQVVTEYHLTKYLPFDPLFVVLGAGCVETVIAMLLLLGVNMRWNILFFVFWVTLSLLYFGEAVWPHIILFGIATTLFLYGYDRFTLERWLVAKTKKFLPF